jgi:hypothetical protein
MVQKEFMMPKTFTMPRFRLTAEAILYTIAAANAVRIGWAYAYADAGGNLFSAPGLAGGLLGLTLSVGTAFVAGKIPGLKAKIRIRLTWSALALILVLEPVILAPLTVTDMPLALKTTLPGVWGWGWAVIMALLPSLMIAAISFANGAMVEGTVAQVVTERPAPVAKPVETPEVVAEKPAQVAQAAFTAENLIAQYLIDPLATDARLAQVFGKSHTAVGNLRKSLIEQGRIAKVGKEVKVLPEFVVAE